MPNHKTKALLLPTDISKSEVFRVYKQASSDELLPKPVSWAKFQSIWSSILPHIDTMKPSSDLCFECQQYATQVFHSANHEKSDKLDSCKSTFSLLKNRESIIMTSAKILKLSGNCIRK